MKSTTLAATLTALIPMGLAINPALAQRGLSHSHEHTSLHTSSGMLLGVYAHTTHDGLQIVGTIPGYSAEGRLFAGDVLLQATAAGMPMFSIRSHQLMERAKSQIGPFREAAVEFYRPGVGLMYAWVTFQPIGGGDVHPHVHGPQPALAPQGPGQPAFQPPPSGNPNNFSPNNTVMKSELPGPAGNPNNSQPRSAKPRTLLTGPNINANNQSPFSSKAPASANNATPKFQAEFRLESEKPGARRMFRQRGRNPSN